MSDPYIGEIRMFAGVFAPQDWALCDGGLLSIQTYPALFSLFGTTYGGDGVNTFAVPDLRGRLVCGTGTGSGLSPYVPGQKVGATNVTLSADQTPIHTHAMNVGGSTVAATTTNPNGAIFATVSGAVEYTTPPAPGQTGAVPKALNATAATSFGGSQPHTNVMPYMPITYIVALVGLYPDFP